MKRIILIVFAAAFCFMFAACSGGFEGSIFDIAEQDESMQAEEPEQKQPDEKEAPTPEPLDEPEETPTLAPAATPSPTPEPTEELPLLPEPTDPPVSTETEAVLFMDPDIDIFIMVSIPGWTYTTQLYVDEVYFYPEGEMEGVTGMAISSNDKRLYSIADIWRDIIQAMNSYFNDFDWEQTGEVSAGAYTAQEYTFTAEGMKGNYFFWTTQDKIYICSFTASPEEYDELYPKILEALDSFVVYSEIAD